MHIVQKVQNSFHSPHTQMEKRQSDFMKATQVWQIWAAHLTPSSVFDTLIHQPLLQQLWWFEDIAKNSWFYRENRQLLAFGYCNFCWHWMWLMTNNKVQSIDIMIFGKDFFSVGQVTGRDRVEALGVRIESGMSKVLLVRSLFWWKRNKAHLILMEKE